jgi:ribosomal protein L11 methyltransferase
MVLAELTKLPAPIPPYAILDLGTGSGILAIAAAKLFGSPVEAIDIDPMAIENARDNTAMNGVDNLIELSTKPLQELSGPYDLILANVYGEVLVQLASEVSRVAQPHATIIMSGITELVWNQVYTAYCSTLKWRVEDETSENGWVCAVLRR